MRILELVNDLDAGGAQRVVTNLAFDFRSRGQSVHIVCLRELGVTPVPESRYRECGIALSAMGKRDGFSRAVAAELADYVRSARIDVVHTHNPLVNHYGVLAARRGGAPVVVNTIHGINTLRQSLFGRTLYKATCLFTTRVVAVCKAVAEACRKQLPLRGRQPAVICNGIDLNPFLSISRRSPNGRFRFGTVSRLDPIKDHCSLLRGFAQVRAREPKCELHILGKGETEQQLRRLARELGLDGSVHFRGFSRDIAGFLSEMDCFVISSLSEGLPMAVLEAMAAGLPVAGTAVGGVSELVSDSQCGWLCPPGEPEKLAARMMEAMKAEDLGERGARGRAYARAGYSITTMGQNYLALFQDLLKGRAS